ncbi:DUF6950 family protein [Azospirillum sp.]|uniref:DUF6950 family protein n=1 Tax=Azospirillum sp. TaxID=34012 RepID=UPI002D6FB0BB|nr:hypothetical protein [Azospirillum sp.]HYD66163.1 hypothetical protein [Azospirillum sp.]
MADIPRLKNYLSSLAGRRWQPGALDCGVFMADWVMAVRGVDPIADVRGTYSSEREFRRILRREGGFARSCARRLAAVGYAPTPAPAGGDIAVVMAPYAVRQGRILRRPTGAICVSDRLLAVITSDLGIVIADQDRLPLLEAYHHG